MKESFGTTNCVAEVDPVFLADAEEAVFFAWVNYQLTVTIVLGHFLREHASAINGSGLVVVAVEDNGRWNARLELMDGRKPFGIIADTSVTESCLRRIQNRVE